MSDRDEPCFLATKRVGLGMNYDHLVADPRGVQLYAHKNHPRSPRVVLACSHCGRPLLIARQDLKAGRGKYCSRRCKADDASRGADSPCWGGGNPQSSKRVRARERGSTSERDYLRAYRKLHPDRSRAHDVATYAIRLGKLKPPKNCERCGTLSQVHGHHDDYLQPDRVKWLCPSCRRGLHCGQ